VNRSLRSRQPSVTALPRTSLNASCSPPRASSINLSFHHRCIIGGFPSTSTPSRHLRLQATLGASAAPVSLILINIHWPGLRTSSTLVDQLSHFPTAITNIIWQHLHPFISIGDPSLLHRQMSFGRDQSLEAPGHSNSGQHLHGLWNGLTLPKHHASPGSQTL